MQVTMGSDGINAYHILLQLSVIPEETFDVLRGHVVRSNLFCGDMKSDIEVLAVFHGPDACISPSWYGAKQDKCAHRFFR